MKGCIGGELTGMVWVYCSMRTPNACLTLSSFTIYSPARLTVLIMKPCVLQLQAVRLHRSPNNGTSQMLLSLEERQPPRMHLPCRVLGLDSCRRVCGSNLTPEQDADNYYLSRGSFRVDTDFECSCPGGACSGGGSIWLGRRRLCLCSVELNLRINSNIWRLSKMAIDQGAPYILPGSAVVLHDEPVHATGRGDKARVVGAVLGKF